MKASIALCAIGIGLIGGAGLLKLIDLASFSASLKSWTLIPSALVPWLAIGVPNAELLVCGLWFMPGYRRLATWLALGLLCVFTLGYGAQVAFAQPPSCGCLGAVSAALSVLDEWPAVLIRNVLISALLACGLAERVSVPPTADESGLKVKLDHHRARAFTLIELILCVALVAILITLLSPSVSGMRRYARQQVSLSNIRSHTQIMIAYVGDYKDTWPYLTSPDATWSIVRSLSSRAARRVKYFGLYNVWHYGLADGYYNGNTKHVSFQQPYWTGEIAAADYRQTTYWYPCAFVAHSDFWNPSSRVLPERPQLQRTLLTDVSWPASKSLVVGLATAAGSTMFGDRELGFVDGHAELIPSSAVRRGYVDNEGRDSVYTDHGGLSMPPGLHTIDGVRGRDK